MLIKYPLIPQPIVGSGKILLCVKITAHFYIRIFFLIQYLWEAVSLPKCTLK